MPDYNIVRKTDFKDSFRVQQVKSAFCLDDSQLEEVFKGNIDIEGKDWNIGLIVGRSGTGKTTIAKECFSNFYFSGHSYGDKPIVDEMPEGCDYKKITYMFTAVGFSSPPSWLKPYNVLSNGEKMRVDLAYCLLNDTENIVFDEFTSVVDRDVAKVCSLAVSKIIRKLNKKFIAVSCHDDILDWLQPNWVLDTNTMTFYFRKPGRNPELKLDIRKIETTKDKRCVWEIFRKYHYLSSNLNTAAHVYVGYLGDKIVGFCAIMQQVSPTCRDIKRIHRLVVLPDYQGVGIGTALLNYVAKIWVGNHYRVHLITSQLNLIKSLPKKGWIVTSFGHQGNKQVLYRKAMSSLRVTATFAYKPR